MNYDISAFVLLVPFLTQYKTVYVPCFNSSGDENFVKGFPALQRKRCLNNCEQCICVLSFFNPGCILVLSMRVVNAAVVNHHPSSADVLGMHLGTCGISEHDLRVHPNEVQIRPPRWQ